MTKNFLRKAYTRGRPFPFDISDKNWCLNNNAIWFTIKKSRREESTQSNNSPISGEEEIKCTVFDGLWNILAYKTHLNLGRHFKKINRFKRRIAGDGFMPDIRSPLHYQSAGAVEYADTPILNKCPKLSDGEALVLELWGMWTTFSLPLLPGSLLPRAVVSVCVPSMGQIEIFNHFLYLKQFNGLKRNEWIDLLVFRSNSK